MMPDVSDLLTPDVRRRFLADRASILGVVAFLAAAVAVLVVIVFVSPAVDNPARYNALRRNGRFAEAEIDEISAAITEGSSRSRYWRRSSERVISYRVRYHFTVGGETYHGTHYVSAKDVRVHRIRKGAKFLALYDPQDPSNNVLTTAPVSILKELGKTAQTVESLRRQVYIPRGGVPSWVLLLLYFLFVGALGGAGYWIWRRAKAGRVLKNPAVVPALLTEREAVTTRTRTSGGRYRERLGGYRMRVGFVSHAGVSFELSCYTRRRNEAAALPLGSVVTVIYEEAHPKNFLIYELYGERVVKWSDEELRAKMGGFYDLYRRMRESASVDQARSDEQSPSDNDSRTTPKGADND
ncbi:MAG: hypothetical protein DRP82_01170 [Planctomycetota bacterium]|nr:MAG: hypothetical protein DRP82_01170 [Planctomycetota bacterium]